jgi:hypothetical protein
MISILLISALAQTGNGPAVYMQPYPTGNVGYVFSALNGVYSTGLDFGCNGTAWVCL